MIDRAGELDGVRRSHATQLLAWLLGRQVEGFPELGPWRWTRR